MVLLVQFFFVVEFGINSTWTSVTPELNVVPMVTINKMTVRMQKEITQETIHLTIKSLDTHKK